MVEDRFGFLTLDEGTMVWSFEVRVGIHASIGCHQWHGQFSRPAMATDTGNCGTNTQGLPAVGLDKACWHGLWARFLRF